MARGKYLLGAALAVLAMGFLIFRGFQSSSVYYYTLPELFTGSASLEGAHIRVTGKVGPQPVNWDARSRTTSFTLVEGGHSLPIIYQGPVPNGFTVGGDVVVEGKYKAGAPFEAEKLIAKCPTRYVPEP